jgi:transposase
MIRPGFLDPESRQDLIELARDGSAAHRLARRANALVLLDDGMSCAAVAKVLLLDDDTVRTWYRLYKEKGIEGLAGFGYEGGACRLSDAQQAKLKAWVTATLPRSTCEVGAWIEKELGIAYQTRSGLIALLHRLDLEYRKPKVVSRKLDPEKQAVHIKKYEQMLNRLEADEAVVFVDAVHPTHAVRPAGCWAPKETPIAVTQTSGRQRLNIHGAIVNDQKPVARAGAGERQKVDAGGCQLFRDWDSIGAWQPRRAFPNWPPVPPMSCGRW